MCPIDNYETYLSEEKNVCATAAAAENLVVVVVVVVVIVVVVTTNAMNFLLCKGDWRLG